MDDLQPGGIFHRDRTKKKKKGSKKEKRKKGGKEKKIRNRYMIKKSPIVFDSSCVGARCAVLVLYAADRRVLGDFDV